MRSFWTGTLGFGLVSIPVKLYSAAHTANLDLDLLDARDLSHIRYARINTNTQEEVEWENIVKGYKTEDGYVVVNEEDFEAVRTEKTRDITIENFVQVDSIGPQYLEQPYYLAPSEGGNKAYALLRQALLVSGRVGLVSYNLRGRVHLGLLQPQGLALALIRMRYAEEIVPVEELPLPTNIKVNKQELDIALKIIDQFSKPMDLAAYHDDYSDKLREIIAAKVKGKKLHAPKVVKMPAATEDLMAQLKASLAQRRKAS